jgi:hypothetical protein
MMVHLNLLGHSAREIGTQVRKPTSVVTACLKSPWAQDQIRQYHERFLASMQQKTFEPMSAFYDKLEEKLALLDGMTKSENPSVALRAIELWINHTLGSPVKRTEVKVEGTIGHASLAELRFIRDHGRLPTQQEKLALTAPSIDGELAEDDDEADDEK